MVPIYYLNSGLPHTTPAADRRDEEVSLQEKVARTAQHIKESNESGTCGVALSHRKTTKLTSGARLVRLSMKGSDKSVRGDSFARVHVRVGSCRNEDLPLGG